MKTDKDHVRIAKSFMVQSVGLTIKWLMVSKIFGFKMRN